MEITTAEILVDESLQEAIIENWQGEEVVVFTSDILDNDIRIPKKQLIVTLRIPYKSRGDLSHMLIKSKLVFIKKNNAFLLRMNCKVLKPILISTFLGSLFASVVVIPIILVDSVSWFFLILTSLIFSLIHFGLTFLRIKRVSIAFLKELKRKSSI